ncbi:MAG: M20/M25/M40 family metallo-hydrolase, partial [Myxococcaceae bacterium]
REEALQLFLGLLRIDTTNPPGLERAAAEYLAESLRKDGLEPQLLEKAKDRTSVVCRLKGTGEKPPLLLTGHLDVVAAEPSRWKHPPFAAVIDEGWIYARGAIDMKHMAAMSVMTLKLLKRSGVKLKRDLIFAGVADEEAGCHLGSHFLVADHPELVRAEYTLGEIGGYTQEMRGSRLYPIQIAQKGMAWVKVKVEGTPGHGSMPREDNAVLRMSEALAKLTPNALPMHANEPARKLLKAFASVQPFPGNVMLPQLLNPLLTSRVLKMIPDAGPRRALSALIRNTVSPTVVHAGMKTNVIPSSAEAELDGRTVPGQTAQDLMREVQEVVGDHVKLELINEMPPIVMSDDTEMYRHLVDAVKKMDPKGIPVPLMIPGFTDAGPFAKLGTTWYGFAPVVFPEEPKVVFTDMYHGDNERIPVDGFHAGLDALHSVVQSWCA